MINFAYFPLSIAILFPLKCIFTYILAICYGHVNPIFPYISDAGTTAPEAGYFSMFLFVEALLIGVTGWIRFQQIKYICNNSNLNNNKILEVDEVAKLLRLNKYSFYAIILIVILMSIVAAFRSSENLSVHLLGALPVFGISGIFIILQTKISYMLITLNVNSLRIAHIRCICMIIAFVFGTLMMLMILWSTIDLKVPIGKIWGQERLLWDHSYGGYIQHCLSAASEWTIICIFCPFFATYVPEFKKIESHNGEVKFKFVQTTDSIKL